MFETLQNALVSWNRRTSDRQKLQHIYIVLLIAVVFVAGLVSLFSGDQSRLIMYIALALLLALGINYVAWGLLKSSLLDNLPRQTASRTTTPARRTSAAATRRRS